MKMPKVIMLMLWMFIAGFGLSSFIGDLRSAKQRGVQRLRSEWAYMKGAADGIEITKSMMAGGFETSDQACHALYLARSNFLATLPK